MVCPGLSFNMSMMIFGRSCERAACCQQRDEYVERALNTGAVRAGDPKLAMTRRQARTIADHHTDAAEVGHVLQRVQPKLGVFSHFPNIVAAEDLRLIRQSYAGRVGFPTNAARSG
jgi:hypothetical protein